VNLTLPLKAEPFNSNILFPFFDGLIPEGWLLDIAERNWKLNARDRMGFAGRSLISLFPRNCHLTMHLVENPADEEDLALTLNGKKKKIIRNDFITAFRTLDPDPKQQENIFRKMINAKAVWMDLIGISFLCDDFTEHLINIIEQRIQWIF
jgi:hypothetical protein